MFFLVKCINSLVNYLIECSLQVIYNYWVFCFLFMYWYRDDVINVDMQGVSYLLI